MLRCRGPGFRRSQKSCEDICDPHREVILRTGLKLRISKIEHLGRAKRIRSKTTDHSMAQETKMISKGE